VLWLVGEISEEIQGLDVNRETDNPQAYFVDASRLYHGIMDKHHWPDHIYYAGKNILRPMVMQAVIMASNDAQEEELE
jgi:hypothetical protein